jgi:hypothetical protein
MEILYRRKVIYFLVFILFGCFNNKNYEEQLNGHWSLSYGPKNESYEEVIYYDHRVCSYSNDFGLVFREYKTQNDILEIYNDNVLEAKRRVVFNGNEMRQRDASKAESKELIFHRIKDSQGILIDKLFEGDTVQQNNFIKGYMAREGNKSNERE